MYKHIELTLRQQMVQARLAGALAAIKRSRSADDGQDALIQMLQGMLGNAAQQQQNGHQHGEQVGHATCRQSLLLHQIFS
jgi:hypothetical protein